MEIRKNNLNAEKISLCQIGKSRGGIEEDKTKSRGIVKP